MIYKLVSYMPNLRELDFDKDLVSALLTMKMKASESYANQAGEDDKLKPTMTVILDDNRKQVVPVQLHQKKLEIEENLAIYKDVLKGLQTQ